MTDVGRQWTPTKRSPEGIKRAVHEFGPAANPVDCARRGAAEGALFRFKGRPSVEKGQPADK
jgi:hypothetical protein